MHVCIVMGGVFVCCCVCLCCERVKFVCCVCGGVVPVGVGIGGIGIVGIVGGVA